MGNGNELTYCLTNKSLGGSVNPRSAGLNMATMDPRAILEDGGVSLDSV